MWGILRAVLGAIVGPLVDNARKWMQGREARNQIALTTGLQAEVISQQAQINGLKIVTEIYAEKNPDVRATLVALGLRGPGAGGADS